MPDSSTVQHAVSPLNDKTPQSSADDYQTNLETAAKFLSQNTSVLHDLPTPVIQSIAAQATKYESLKSQKLFDDVSYEQDINGSKGKIKAIRQQLDAALSESQELRTQLAEIHASKSSLERDLLSSKSLGTTTSDRISSLEQRLAACFEDKRQLLGSMNQKTIEAKELQAEREKARKSDAESRKSIINLETQIQQLKSSQISTKMKEQNQQQEIELLKQNTQWLESELKTKSDDFNKFRSEKLELVSRLQTDLSNTQSSLQIIKNSNDKLKSQFADTSKQLSDALVKIKDLQDSQASNEENFRVEITSQKRLVELWERSAKDAKKRIEGMESHLESLRARETAEIEKWKSEAENERLRAESLAKQIATLEGHMESSFIENDRSSALPQTPVGKSTPSTSSNGIFSPSAKIISEIKNGGGSLTQLYTDYQETKARLERERFKNITLREQMNEIVKEMESHAPAVLAEREENIRLERELTEISLQLEQSMKTADEASEKLKETEIRAQDYQREAKLLDKQVSDLSRQVQNLLIQNKLISDSENPLTADEHTTLQKILRGDDSPNESDTDKLISQRLVLFKNVVELQKQNANLLKITRELGLQMENKEKEISQKFNDVESAAIIEAKDAIKSLQDDISSLNTKLEAAQRERDMFRRMLSNKHKDGVSLADLAESSPEGLANSQTQLLISQNEQLSSRVRELETEFFTYRQETSETIKSLDLKNSTIGNERSNLQIQLAKTESKLELSNERQKHLSSNLEILRSENNDFKQRAQALQDTVSKQDIRVQKLSEDLALSQSASESIKHENANLKAEKSIWKSIEERLTKDNASLIEERGRFSALLANYQSLETERSNAATQLTNHLNNQISSLENESANLRKKLDTQTDDLKSLSQRREHESRDYQERITQLTKDLSETNQSLLSSKSEYEKLQVNFNGISAKLDAANEKIKSLETTGPMDPDSREYVLKQEISSLKSSLELTKSELELSKKNAEELRGVATAAETALRDMNASHDAYMASTDKHISEKEESINNLKEQLASTSKILTETKQTYLKLDEERQKKIKALTDDQQRLQGLVQILQNNESKFNDEIQKIKDDLAQQIKISDSSRQNYDQELVKHADAANSLNILRAEYADLKEQVNEFKQVAESAAEKLSSSQSSWNTQKYTYEQEIEKLKSRSEEISTQNKLLLDQLELVNSRTTQPPPTYQEATENSNDAQLRELVTILKREKEIVDVKYELNVQEMKRLKQNLDHTNTSLDQARIELEKLRQEKLNEDNSPELKRLQDQANDINILRESNSTLRQQSNFYSSKTKELEGQIETLRTKIEPLEGKLREQQAEIDAKESQIKLVQKEADDWKTRTQNILHKYERIDPKAFEDLKESNAKLTKQAADMKGKLSNSTRELNDAKLKLVQSSKELLEAKNKFDTANKELTDVKTKLETATNDLGTKTTEISALNTRFAKLKTEFLEKLKKQRTTVTGIKEQYEKANAELTKLKAVQLTDSNEVPALQSQLNTIKSELETVTKEKDELKTQIQTSTQSSNQIIVQLRAQVESLQSNVNSQPSEDIAALKTELSSTKESLSAKEGELATLKIQNSGATDKQLAEEISEKSKRIQALEEEVNKLSDQILDLQQNNGKLETPNTEATQQKDKEIQSLRDANVALTSKVEELSNSSNQATSTKEEHEKQLAQLRSEINSKITEATTEERKKVEDTFQARLNELRENAKERIRVLVTEKQTKMEQEYKEKEKALRESLDKSQNVNNTKVNGNTNDPAVIQKLEADLKTLKEEAAEEKKKAIELTRKEFDMRIRLLQSKADKAEAEKVKLQTKLSELGGDNSDSSQKQQQQQHQFQGKNINTIPNFTPSFQNSFGNTNNGNNENNNPSFGNAQNPFQFPSSSQFNNNTNQGSQGTRFPARGGFNQGRNNVRGGAPVNQTNVGNIPTQPTTTDASSVSGKIQPQPGAGSQSPTDPSLTITGVKRAGEGDDNVTAGDVKRSKNAEEGSDTPTQPTDSNAGGN